MTTDANEPERVRMPFPVPQLRAAVPGKPDAAAYKAEASTGKPTPMQIGAISASGYGLFQATSEATLTPAEAAVIADVLHRQTQLCAKLLPEMPMPQSEHLTADDKASGKIYSPYLFMMGLNLMAQGMAEMSPETTTVERLAMISEFVRTWAMYGQMTSLEEAGMSPLDVKYIAGCHAVIQPPFLPEIGQLYLQMRAAELANQPEPERDIPVQEGDGLAAVQRPAFKLT